MALVQSCSTTKDLYSGTYDWSVTGTPDGDYSGDMNLLQAKDGVTGTMSVAGETAQLKDVYLKADSLAFTATANGLTTKTTAKFVNGAFRGQTSAMGFKFPFTATPKKK